MQYEVTASSRLNLTVDLPSSKSVSNRALIIHALAGGGEMPQNLSDCDDTRVMMDALSSMPDVIDIGAAGTAMRFLTAYLAVTSGSHILTGTERMRHRPIGVLVDALRRLGADITYVGEEGFPPLRVDGRPLDGGPLEIEGNVSSQYISALLMIGPALRHGLTLHMTGDVISRPYIDMTLWMMGEFGAEAEWTDASTIEVKPRPYSSRPYCIENDWSSASYWYEMVALGPEDSAVTLTGLKDSSKQGDSSVRYIFSLLGVKTEFCGTSDPNRPTTVRLTRNGRRVPRLEYDFVNSPDLAQTVVACCAVMNMPFHFTGLQTLKIKETDRIEALKAELLKLGYVLRDIDGRELLWDGTHCEPQPTPVIETYNDHRMALAFAPLALCRERMVIDNPMVVTKSYPHYWEDLAKAGMEIKMKNEERRVKNQLL